MRAYFSHHPLLKWSAIVLAALIAAIILFLLLFDWNALRPWLARTLSDKSGHEVAIRGDLKVHPWSFTPSVSLDGLTVRNPRWARQPNAFSADHILVRLSLGHLLKGDLLLPLVELTRPQFSFERRPDGRTNWDRPQPSPPPPADQATKLPAVRRLLIERGELHVDDRIRKLQVQGEMHADEKAANAQASAFEMQSKGTINDRPFTVRLSGPALVNIDPDTPYTLHSQVVAGDIHADADLTIDKPFDLSAFKARFNISGNDLADAYYLTNLALPNTAPYRVSASLTRSGEHFSVRDLKGKVGSSDIAGQAGLELGGERPRLVGDLVSSHLDLKDLVPALGHRKAVLPAATADKGGKKAGAPAPAVQSLFPDADLQLQRVRAMDADVTFKGASVTGKIPVKEIQVHATLTGGLLRLQPVSFVLEQGRFNGRVQIDARRSNPESQIEMTLSDANLAQFKPRDAKEAPMSGALHGRMRLHGYGTSVHKFVSDMDGNINFAVPQGEIRSAFAELTGINIAKGLGLLLTGAQGRTEVRCAVVALHAQDGQLAANTLLMDTTNVLITGHGGIDLAKERLDLSVGGEPKSPRLLRLRSPVLIRGNLTKPRIDLEADKTLLQAGAATALGALLTPVAAALAFIDPGMAKDANCAAVLATPPGGKAPK